MKKPTPTPLTETPPMRDVTPGSEVKTATVAVLPLLAVFGAAKDTLAAQIRADMDCYDRMSRDAALIALRVGLRLIWIRDNQAHGTLQMFMAEHFADKGQRTLYRYITVADQFLTDAGLRDKATFKLTGKSLAAVAPICEVQLELFSDPEARLEGALKKLVKWLGDRGLAEIYREMEGRKSGHTMPPKHGKGGRPSTESITPEMYRLAAQEQAELLLRFYGGKSWRWLDDDELIELERLIEPFHSEVKKLIDERQEAATAVRPRTRKDRAA